MADVKKNRASDEIGGINSANDQIGVQMKFRKKPVVIEATQWFKHGDHPVVKKRMLGDGASDAWIESNTGWIETLEGGHIVTPGDWIITGVAGEHYPCKPEIFEATYEMVMPSDEDYMAALGPCWK